MSKKRILLITVVLLVLIILGISIFSNSDVQSDEPITSSQNEEVTAPSDASQSSDSLTAETQPIPNPAPVYEDGLFAFTAGQLCEQFEDTLPEGYIFADAVEANASRNAKMQIDILDAAGIPTDIGVLMDVQELDSAYSQMALVMKDDCNEEDVAAMMQWYIATFLTGFNEEEQTVIYEDYLDMFTGRFEEYRLYAAQSHDVMMIHQTEGTENYYYILISLQ